MVYSISMHDRAEGGCQRKEFEGGAEWSRMPDDSAGVCEEFAWYTVSVCRTNLDVLAMCK
jgi:hypothetical protein